MAEDIDRRQVLKRIGVAGLVGFGVPLAGCSGNDSRDREANGGTGDGEDGGGDENGGSNGGGGAVETSTVEMTDQLTFEPKNIKISPGTTVTWENVGTIGHTVTAYEDDIPDDASYFASGGYSSEQEARNAYKNSGGGNIPGGESYEHTFETTGEYRYFCIPHELSGMVGTVTVE